MIPVSPLLSLLSLTQTRALPTGILLPDSVLASPFFAVFSAFVGINTVVYVALAVAKILPRVYLTDWVGGRSRRARDRSIHGLDPIPGRPPLLPQPPATGAVPTPPGPARHGVLEPPPLHPQQRVPSAQP